MTAALRTVYYDMPQAIQVPSEFQHRTIEVIMLPIDEVNNTTLDFKSWLQNMPDVDDENIYKIKRYEPEQSMGYLIGTNILSELRKKQNANPNVKSWFNSVTGEQCYLSVLTIGEIVNGIKRLESKDMNSAKSIQAWLDRVSIDFSDRILPITANISTVWGEMTAKMPMPVVDSLLASTAIIHNLTLVTRNIKDVEHTGAILLNPFEDVIL